MVYNETRKLRKAGEIMAVHFYLVRHGQTELNKKRRMQGITNSPLTKKGVKKAIKLGQQLADVRFAAVYTSDLSRTKETAELIISQNLVYLPPIYREPALREYDFGRFEMLPNWQMLPKAQKIVGAKSLLKAMMHENHVASLTELVRKLNGSAHAETAAQMTARIKNCLKQIAKEYDGRDVNILIVAHGLLLANFLESLGVKVPLFLLGNSKASRVDYENGYFRVVYINKRGKKVK